MERFTFRTVGGTSVLYLGNSSEWAIISGRNNHEYKISGDAAERLAAYEDTGLEPEDLKKAFNETAILKLAAQALSTTPDHLRDILQAEKEGRLVVLPCKVGATVYGHSNAEVSEYKVAVISLATYNWYLRCQNHNSDFWVTDADIGKTVFLTREEAEAALKGGDLPENRTD